MNESINTVRDTWRKDYPDLAAGNLSDEVVWEIAWLLVQSGIQPTAAGVREVHGGGSPNLIHPALRSFFERELAARWNAPAQPCVPEPLMKLWRESLKAAEHAAEETLAGQREDLAARMKIARELSQKHADARREAEARAEQLERRIHELRGRLASLTRAERNQSQDKDRAVVRADQAEASVKEAQSKLDDAHATLKEKDDVIGRTQSVLDAVRDNEHKTTIALRESEKDVEQLSGEVAAHVATAKDRNTVIGGLRHDATARAKKYEQQRESTAKQHEEQAAKLRQDNSDLIKRLDAAGAEASVHLATIQSVLGKHKQALKELEATRAEVAAERKRYEGLEASIDQLRKVVAENGKKAKGKKSSGKRQIPD